MEKWHGQFIKSLFHYDPDRMHIERAFLIKHPHVPASLFKYRNFSDNHLDALAKNVLWLSAPERFNDPFDNAVSFDPDRILVEDQSLDDFLKRVKAIKAIKASGGPWKPANIKNPIQAGEWRRKRIAEILARPGMATPGLAEILEDIMRQHNSSLVESMTKTFRKSYSALSLSGTCESKLMWAHYSDSHRGFCIEYNLAALPGDDLLRRLCYPVFYTAKPRDATRYLHRMNNGTFNNLFGVLMSLMKSSEWSYEKEWRIVHILGASLANRELEMPEPVSITLGADVTPENEAKMRDICRVRSIPLFKMKVAAGYNLTRQILFRP